MSRRPHRRFACRTFAALIALTLAGLAASGTGVGAATVLRVSSTAPVPDEAGGPGVAPAAAVPPAQPATRAPALEIRGRVVDTDQHPIAYVTIQIPEVRRTIVTDQQGRFTISLPPGPYVLRASRLGYEPGTVEIYVHPLSAPEPVVQLVTRPLQAPRVVVEAVRRVEPTHDDPSRHELDPEELGRQIGGFEDVMRGVQAQPGVASASDLQGDFMVRGSASTANSILLDGIEIPFPFHILGFNSIFNPGVLESAELYTGGAPAEFGNSTGGVLSLRSRGAAPTAERGAIGLSYLSAHAHVSFGDAHRGGFASFRRSYQDQLLRLVDSSLGRIVPVFHDAFVRGRWQPRPGHLLTVGVLHAGDGMSLPSPEVSAGNLDFITADGPDRAGAVGRYASQRDRLELDNRMIVGSLAWRAVLGPTAYLETTLGYVPQRFNFSLEGDNHESVVIDAWRASIRQDLTWRPGRHQRKLGWQAYRDDTTRRVSAWAGILTLRDTNSALNLVDLKERYEFDRARRRDLVAAYAQDEWEASRHLVLGGGLRVVRDGLAQETLVSPRISTEWRGSPRWNVRATLGLYRDLREEPMEVLPTVDGNPLGAERSLEATLGGTLVLRPDLRSGGAVYSKWLDHLAYEIEPAYYANGGIARARGLEAWLRYEPARLPIRGALTYSWSHVRQRDPLAWRREVDYRASDPQALWVPVYETPYWYRPSQDEPHRLAIEGFLQRGTWALGLRYQVASGRPYTPVEWVATDPLDTKYGIVGGKGSARYPAFQRLDVRVQRTMQRGRVRYSFYADVLNATGADNVFQYRYDRDYRVRYTVKMLPILPTLGIEATF